MQRFRSFCFLSVSLFYQKDGFSYILKTRIVTMGTLTQPLSVSYGEETGNFGHGTNKHCHHRELLNEANIYDLWIPESRNESRNVQSPIFLKKIFLQEGYC